MTKKKAQPLDVEFGEDMVAGATPEESAPTGEPVFDFTEKPQPSDGEAFRVYSMLSRKAKLARDASQLPDGKVYTLSQVVEILGEDYAAGLGINAKCCG